MHRASLYAERAVMAGARGYITKEEAPLSVISAIHTVLSGRMYLSDEIKEKILMGFSSCLEIQEHESPLDRLTPGKWRCSPFLERA